MSNNLDPDQGRQFVGLDLGPSCLPRLSADGTGRQSVKLCFRAFTAKFLGVQILKYFTVNHLRFYPFCCAIEQVWCDDIGQSGRTGCTVSSPETRPKNCNCKTGLV